VDAKTAVVPKRQLHEALKGLKILEDIQKAAEREKI
jgi:hypothetical protein